MKTSGIRNYAFKSTRFSGNFCLYKGDKMNLSLQWQLKKVSEVLFNWAGINIGKPLHKHLYIALGFKFLLIYIQI